MGWKHNVPTNGNLYTLPDWAALALWEDLQLLQRYRSRVSNSPILYRSKKIGDWKKLETLVQKQSFWNIVGARPTAAPRNSGRDNAARRMMTWWTSLPHILQIHSLHQVATGTPFHVPLRRREIIITIFHGFGTNCMVPSIWDLAPRCFCGTNLTFD